MRFWDSLSGTYCGEAVDMFFFVNYTFAKEIDADILAIKQSSEA